MALSSVSRKCVVGAAAFVAVAFLFAGPGCSKGAGSASKAGGAIEVGGEWVTHDEIVRASEMLRQSGSQQSPAALFEASDSAGYLKEAARQLVMNKLMLLEARARKIAVDSARERKTFESMRSGFPDEASFQRELTKAGQTVDMLKKQVHNGLLVEALVKDVFEKMDTITIAESRKFYDDNPGKFSARTKMRLGHLFIGAPQSLAAEKRKTARGRAQALLAKCRGGADFSTVARTESQGPEASSGGDLGWFTEKDLNPLFAKAVLVLTKGQVSEVVESENGYHILKKVDEMPAGVEPFENVRKDIALSLEMQRRNLVIKAMVDSLVKVSKITYVDKAFEGLF